VRRGILISGALHIGVIGATLVAWPHALDLSDDESPVVPVELVTVADVSNIAPTVTQPEPEPVVEPTPPPEPVAEQEPPPPEEVAPDTKPPPPDEKPAEKPEDVAQAPRNPVIPKPRPPAEKPQKFDLDNVLALLDKRAPKPPPAPANARVAQQAVRGIGAQNAMTLDIRDALLAQMRECWNVPAGAPEPEQLIVQVRVFLARDGDLAQPPQLTPESRAAMASNAYIRTAGEAALRAVNVCAPYHDLPTDRYDVWREIVMTFDPSKMAGR
jgi:outer membrane biosynthesis protein TonB